MSFAFDGLQSEKRKRMDVVIRALMKLLSERIPSYSNTSVGVARYRWAGNPGKCKLEMVVPFGDTSPILSNLERELAPSGGSPAGVGIKQAVDILTESDAEKRAVILIFDGEEIEGEKASALIPEPGKCAARIFAVQTGMSKSGEENQDVENVTAPNGYVVAQTEEELIDNIDYWIRFGLS